jgi:hypothetical protein
VPRKLLFYFNDLKKNGGPLGAAGSGDFCRKPADFADFSIAHDRVAKPVPTFRDHAPA